MEKVEHVRSPFLFPFATRTTVSPFFYKTSINAHRTERTVPSEGGKEGGIILLLTESNNIEISDGNDKIEERVKEKQNKEKRKEAPEKPIKRKKVDLTFDYDPEKECE